MANQTKERRNNMSKVFERETNESPKKVSLQEIYDLRELTGFISGNDLHDFFRELVNDPSPSGRVEVNEATLMETDQGKQILALLNSPLREHLEDLIVEMKKAALD